MTFSLGTLQLGDTFSYLRFFQQFARDGCLGGFDEIDRLIELCCSIELQFLRMILQVNGAFGLCF